MSSEPNNRDEEKRLKALEEYKIMDTAPEEELDALTKLASVVCNTPIALISLLDGDRQWFKSNIGLDTAETPRNISFCQYAIMGNDIYEIKNATENPRFAENPLVTGSPHIRFYAGAPLIDPQGFKLGSLCVIDTVPKELDEKQKETLRLLSQLAINHFELRRKKAEMEKTKTLFHKMVEESADIIYSSDEKGNFTFINQKVEHILGYKPGELLGKNFREIIVPEWRDRTAQFYAEQFHKLIPETTMEFPVYTKSGELRWIEQTVASLIADGRIEGFQGVVRDITERKSYETQLLETKALLTQAMSIGRLGSFENNVKTQKITWSKEIFEMMDMADNMRPLSYKEYLQMIHPEDIEQVMRNIEKTIATKRPDVNINRFITGKGRLKWIETRVVPMFDLNGDLVMFRGTMQDITDQKELEKLLIASKEMAEQSVIAKEQFLANMSHEIRTPMNAVLGFADLLVTTPLENDQKEYVEAIRQSGKNLMTIINDILDYSKIEAGMMTMEEIPLSIRSIFSSLSVLYGQQAKEKNLELNFIPDGNIPETVCGDSTRLTQVITNLVGNALKFTAKGSITVTAQLVSKGDKIEVKFAVQDTGIGIAPDKINSVFERFNQGTNSTTRQYGGTGLGLSIVKKLVELQGGKVGVKSTLGQGSTFEFTIVFRETEQLALEHFKPITGTDNGKPPQEIHILLVEDNIMNQKLAHRILQNIGYQVEIAGNGKIAVDMVQEKKYDLLLMDMQMPEMDGYEAATLIRRKLNNKVPIIAMTAHAMIGEKEKCLELGMNDYISKPFNAEDLHARIRALVGGKRETTSTVVPPTAQTKTGLISLDGLMKVSGGDKVFVREMLEIFTRETPAELKLLEEAIALKDYNVIKKVSHKLVSSVALVGLKDKLVGLLHEMEDLGKTQGEMQQIKKLYNELLDTCTAAVEEARGMNF